MKNFLFILLFSLSVGCANKKTITVDGKTYTLIRPAHTNSNGNIDVALYERNGVTNFYYIRDLTGHMQTIIK
jgi:hypothetical protein